jgi:hypothetical protein
VPTVEEIRGPLVAEGIDVNPLVKRPTFIHSLDAIESERRVAQASTNFRGFLRMSVSANVERRRGNGVDRNGEALASGPTRISRNVGTSGCSYRTIVGNEIGRILANVARTPKSP